MRRGTLLISNRFSSIHFRFTLKATEPFSRPSAQLVKIGLYFRYRTKLALINPYEYLQREVSKWIDGFVVQYFVA
jgi:hypothetical protein